MLALPLYHFLQLYDLRNAQHKAWSSEKFSEPQCSLIGPYFRKKFTNKKTRFQFEITEVPALPSQLIITSRQFYSTPIGVYPEQKRETSTSAQGFRYF